MPKSSKVRQCLQEVHWYLIWVDWSDWSEFPSYLILPLQHCAVAFQCSRVFQHVTSFSNLLKHFQCSRRSSLLITKSIKSTMFPLSGKAVTLIKEIHPHSLAWSAWRKSMLHFSYFPFTTISLIIVSLQICSKSWHAAEVRPVVIRIASFVLSSSPLSLFHLRAGIQYCAVQRLMHHSDSCCM